MIGSILNNEQNPNYDISRLKVFTVPNLNK